MFRVPAALAHISQGEIYLNAKTFIFFSLRPDSKLLSQQDRTKAIALSILMGLLTLGLGHLFCKIVCEIKKQQANAHVEKIIAIAQKELCCPLECLEAAVPAFVSKAYMQQFKNKGYKSDPLTVVEQAGFATLLPYMSKLNEQDRVRRNELNAQIQSLSKDLDAANQDELATLSEQLEQKNQPGVFNKLNAEERAAFKEQIALFEKQATLAHLKEQLDQKDWNRSKKLEDQIESLMDKEAKQLVGLLAFQQMDKQLRKEARFPATVRA